MQRINHSPATRMARPMGMLPVALVVFVAAAILVPAIGFAAIGCVTDACHAGFQRKTPTHPGDAECAVCHLNVADDHSAPGGTKPGLREDMCASCHEELLTRRVMHKPVSRTSCQLCHDPHGDMANKLLPASYSTELFINYDDKAYSLCFTCHKRDLLMFPDTSYSTGFRNGIRNLHFLHVNKANRGRSCKLCHDVHGATGEKLVAETVFFGNWRMPVAFRKTENGGGCAPGCHQPRQYDRNARGIMAPREEAPAGKSKK